MAAKGAWIIILCSILAHFFVSNTSFQLFQTQSLNVNVAMTGSLGLVYLFYPLVGLVTDVYFTRYKAVLASTVIQIVTSGFGVVVSLVWTLLWYCNSNLVIQGGTSENNTHTVLGVLALLFIIPMIVGLGIFEANAIQFGMDQLLEESSEKISTFIHWYYWSIGVGISLMTLPITAFLSIGIYTNCSIIDIPINKSDDEEYYIRTVFTVSVVILQFIMAIVSFVVLLRCKKHLSIEPAGNNPFATVYQVLKYSWKHKVPERRSAFTYWEEDIPRRIDLGKNKYGGPFTTEEVEDTKSFFSILLLLLSLFGFQLSGNGFTVVRQLTIKLCPSAWVMLLTTASPPLLETITALLFIGLFDLLLLPFFRRYVPSLFKRLGIGLSLILLQELAGIMIVWRANEDFVEPHCNSTKTISRNHFAHCFLGRFNFNQDGDCAAANITKEYPLPHCEGQAVNYLFLWILIPQLVRSVAYLLVFTTALEFICAQAPLRMKGLLIGIWYATFALQYLATHVPDEVIESYVPWIIFHGVRAGHILFSLIMYCIVAKRYRYRLRDEVVNERFLVEEIYERQLLQAEEYERDKVTREPVSCTPRNSLNYGAIPKTNDS